MQGKKLKSQTKGSIDSLREILMIKESWNPIRGKPGHTQPKAVVLEATFPWRLSLCKLIKDIYWFFPMILVWSKNWLIGWETKRLDERHNWPHPIKSGSLRCQFPLMTTLCKKQILSRKIDQRFLQSNWMGGLTSHAQPKVEVSDDTFLYDKLHT